MTEPKFTPGPWLVGRPHNEDVPSAINGWNYYPIYYGNEEEQVCDIVYNKADANLIAAAPELYEACRFHCETRCKMRNLNKNVCKNCLYGKALRKARGESEVEK